ncbi:MAG: FG-GAP repeat protein [Deltaproteobacteria bacterium]|nr:FG-GAP repeat protein [Deltaproteobacteria bacterium]
MASFLHSTTDLIRTVPRHLAWIAALLALALVTGCGDNNNPAPDAAADAQPDLTADNNAIDTGSGQDTGSGLDTGSRGDTAPVLDTPGDAGIDTGGDATTTADGDVTTDATPPMDVPTAVTVTIGAAGGTATLGGLTLTIPPGALTSSQSITVASTTATPPTGYMAFSPIYQFTPAGLTFALPVTVTIPFTGSPVAPVLFWSLATGSGYESRGGTVTGGAVRGTITHFSTGFVGTGGDAGTTAGDGGTLDGGAGDVTAADTSATTDTGSTTDSGAAPDASTGLDATADIPTATDTATSADAGADTATGSDTSATADVAPAAIAAPRQLAPMPTATVTAMRPTLRWILGSGVTGAYVTLCRNRALTTGCASFDAVGSSAAPATSLAAGVWFWRLAGRMGTTTGTSTSPVWEFTVRARTAATDTSWGTMRDVNGDGFADVLVGAWGGNRAYLYLGSATGVPTTASATLTGPDPGGFGTSVASVGDVNGDGYADYAVGAPYASAYAGRVYIYLGSATGLATPPAITLTGAAHVDPARYSMFGQSMAAGDFNGDGYIDLAVGAPVAPISAGFTTGTVFVYFGNATGLATTATTVAGMSAQFGMTMASAGDTNGDGYADLVIGAPGLPTAGAFVYVGSATGLSFGTVFGGEPGSGFGGKVASAGDVNGDGYADLIFGADQTMGGTMGFAYLHLGRATGIPSDATTVLPGLPFGRDNSYFGSAVTGDDFNGDGYADVVVGEYGLRRARVYLGSATGLAMTAGVTLSSPDAGDQFGARLASAGDVNGDGFPDLLVGSHAYSTNTGRVRLFLGATTGLPTTASATLTGAGTGGYFGSALAH